MITAFLLSLFFDAGLTFDGLTTSSEDSSLMISLSPLEESTIELTEEAFFLDFVFDGGEDLFFFNFFSLSDSFEEEILPSSSVSLDSSKITKKIVQTNNTYILHTGFKILQKMMHIIYTCI